MTIETLTRPTAEDVAAEMHWRGLSGEIVTGADAAHHLESVLALLDKRGWTRTSAEPELDESAGLRDVIKSLVRFLYGPVRGPLTVDEAMLLVPAEDGDDDSRLAAKRCMESVLRMRTGATHADPGSWSERRGRTFEEVRGLLAEAAAFAREYGPAA